ncbi:MAG: Uncharacterised protein [Flavobacteriales bacterium]|nr:MAG: Uncharacterised protein [Flavobacteriales bacterium]
MKRKLSILLISVFFSARRWFGSQTESTFTNMILDSK